MDLYGGLDILLSNWNSVYDESLKKFIREEFIKYLEERDRNCLCPDELYIIYKKMNVTH